MTCFKYLIMRQNSPLLLVNGQPRGEEEKRKKISTSNARQTKVICKKQSRTSFVTSTPLHRNCQLEGELELSSNSFATATTSFPAAAPDRREVPISCQQIVTSCRGRRRPQVASRKEASQSESRVFSQQRIFNFFSQSRSTKAEAKRLAMFALLILATCSTLLGQLSQGASSPDAQYFEVQPEAINFAQSGQDVRLRCLIRNRINDCLWMHNGRIVGPIAKKYQFNRAPDDGDCSILIKNITVHQDDGSWQCQVLASDLEIDNGIQSRDVQLTVLVAPERPQIKNVSQGTHKLVLEENKQKLVVCEIRGGNPAPQIEWLLDNKNITKEAQTSSSTSQTPAGGPNAATRITQSRLRLGDIKRSMNGKNLTCVGVHQTINQSNSAELDVQYVPTVSVVQREYSIVEGSPLSVSCQVDSNPPPNMVNWRLVGEAKSQQLALPNKPGPVLEFDRISRELNQNVFECMAQNSYGVSAPADIKLNVLYAPYLLNTSSSNSVLVGQQATLDCIFDGNPPPEVKWLYTDPLARSPLAQQLENNKRQSLTISNVTYRNEGDYHCEARNQINGVYYGVRSSNIALDVYGEPQFLLKSPVHAKAVQGSKSDLTLAFCSDPIPNKVYWHFGSLRLDVRLTNINGNGPQANGSPVALPGGPKQTNALNSRYQAHPLQALQKRDSAFSKQPTCFEAQLSILEPEMIDQRDYTLMVQNERGHQAAVVRLRVSSPLSPVLMITSAFLTICSLFIFSFLIMFLVKKRNQFRSASQRANGVAPNGTANGNGNGLAGSGKRLGLVGEKNGVEHLAANGNGAAAIAAAAVASAQQMMQQQTRNGIVNGPGNGVANGASNPSKQQSMEATGHLMSMASSDTSGDQKQLLANSDRNSSASGSTTNQGSYGANHGRLHQLSNHLSSPNSIGGRSSSSIGRGLDDVSMDSIQSPHMNHISVDEELQQQQQQHEPNPANTNLAYQPDEVGLTRQQFGRDIIYANLDYKHQQHSPGRQQYQMEPEDENSCSLSPSNSVVQASQSRQQQLPGSPAREIRSSVGATIAMMNNLAAAAGQTQQPSSGALSGAISQQFSNSAGGRQIRKPGPPKPPKPSIQQRSRFYQQVANSNNNGLVMIGSMAGDPNESQLMKEPSANELAVEYSRIAFPARAEL